jgi:hypothetical protein
MLPTATTSTNVIGATMRGVRMEYWFWFIIIVLLLFWAINWLMR